MLPTATRKAVPGSSGEEMKSSALTPLKWQPMAGEN